jgi:hypothetical protein
MNAKVDEPAKWLPPQKDSREIEPEENHDARRYDRELDKRRREHLEIEATGLLAAETEEDRED